MQTNNKLREALGEILERIDAWRTDGSMEHWQYSQLFDIADAALAEPVKNCEVGTAKEQTIRFKKFCLDNRTENDFGCGDCPCYSEDSDTDRCGILWEQMPYEEGGKI